MIKQNKMNTKQEKLEELAKEFYSDENQIMERIAFKRGYTECEEGLKPNKMAKLKWYLRYNKKTNKIKLHWAYVIWLYLKSKFRL